MAGFAEEYRLSPKDALTSEAQGIEYDVVHGHVGR